MENCFDASYIATNWVSDGESDGKGATDRSAALCCVCALQPQACTVLLMSVRVHSQSGSAGSPHHPVGHSESLTFPWWQSPSGRATTSHWSPRMATQTPGREFPNSPGACHSPQPSTQIYYHVITILHCLILQCYISIHNNIFSL